MIAVLVCLSTAILIAQAPKLYNDIDRPASAVVPPPPVAIFADCEMTSIPLSIAPQTSLHMLALNKKFMLSQQWGLADIPNRSDKQQQWPTKEAMASMMKRLNAQRPHFGPGVFGYKCDVLNDSKTNVLDVAITMTFWYDKQTGDDNINNADFESSRTRVRILYSTFLTIALSVSPPSCRIALLLPWSVKT